MNLDIEYNGKVTVKLNPHLVTKQGLTEQEVEVIKGLHLIRLSIEYQMDLARYEDLKFLGEQHRLNALELQKAWKFPENPNYYKFWLVPGCICAKLDNDDAYPTGYYSITTSCPVHGS